MIKDRRIGEFMVEIDSINGNPDAVLKLMAGCIVLKAEYEFGERGIRYTAIHPSFAALDPGQSTLPYNLRIVQRKEIIVDKVDGHKMYAYDLKFITAGIKEG